MTERQKIFFTVSITIVSCFIIETSCKLETLKQWNILPYNFAWDAPVNDINFYNPENIVATGIAIDRGRIFIATPRLFSGVPATVSTVSLLQDENSNLLKAYPNWAFHTISRQNHNCSELNLVSVYRLRIDSCNRLWILDAGVSRSLEDYEITCPPKILVVDLATDQVVRRIDFPPEVLRGESLFTNLVIDETTSRPENGCDDVFIYISDTVEPAIVVYDSVRDLTWRLTHPAMYPDPNFAESEILKDRFVLMDGIIGLSFDHKRNIIYFQPFATDRLFSITKDDLRAGPISLTDALPVKLVGKKSSQGIGLVVTPNDGSIIFSPLTETAVAEWNPLSNKQRILARDEERLQFVADMTLAKEDPSHVYVLSSKFQRFFLKNLNKNEINIRIMKIRITEYDEPISVLPFPQYKYSIFHPGKFQTHTIKDTRIPTVNQETPGKIVDGFFTGIRRPFSNNGLRQKDKTLANPFTALNWVSQHSSNGYVYPKGKLSFENLNGLSYLKSS